MLSEREKREAKEMAVSETLRKEFQTLRQNSRALERRITVDALIEWLNAMSRVCPAACKPRQMIAYANVRI